ncbi:MAG: hypothetical protein ABEH88_09080 [Halobacteriales archaeon]
MSVTRAKSAATSVFHPGWVLTGIGVGLGLNLLAGLLGIGLLGGLPSYFIMGVLVGVASPGSTIIEPGVAAFVIAAAGYVLGNLLLSLFVVGLVPAIGFGAAGLVLGVAGGWVGEQL